MDVKLPSEYRQDVYKIHKDAPGQMFILNAFQNNVQPPSLKKLMAVIKSLGHKIPEENIKKINNFIEVQKAAAGIVEHQDKSSFIIVVILGEMNDNEFKFNDGDKIEISRLMRCFFNTKNRGKETPMILILQGKLEIEVQTDASEINKKNDYKLPNKANILIALRKEGDFLGPLSDNLQKYGASKDLMSIVTFSNQDEHPLLLVSTLTRKLILNIDLCEEKDGNREMKKQEKTQNCCIII